MKAAMKTFWLVFKKIIVAADADDISGESAKVAYYFFLSLFPFILVLFAFTGLFGGHVAFDWVMAHLRTALPGPASDYMESFVRDVTESRRPGVLSLGLAAMLYTASNIFVILASGLNTMYNVREHRSWLRRRLFSLAALVATVVLLTSSAAGLVVGRPVLAALGLGTVWHVVGWPVSFLGVAALMAVLYVLLPDRSQKGAWRCVAVGAGAGALLWILATLGFHLYVQRIAAYGRTYGVVGGIIVLLLWLYLTALSILFGGEVAATLEQEGLLGGRPDGHPPSG